MKNKKIIVTRHAYNRITERTEFTSTQRKHIVEQAWKHGYKISRFIDPFYSYLLTKQMDGERTSVKVYDNNIYVFDNRNKRLITIYPIPEEFKPYKQYLGKQLLECVIKINDDEILPIVFKSVQSANNYVKNNQSLWDKEIEIIVL